MNFELLRPFVKRASASPNKELQKKADQFMETLINSQEDEGIVAPGFEAKNKTLAGTPKKDIVDQMILPAFPELAQPDEDDTTFGKVSSAFTSDLLLKDVPKETRADIKRLVPIATNPEAKVVQYGMVVEELLPKVDEINFIQAEERVKQDLADKGKRALGDKFQDKLKTKYILLLNDKIVDGHHFLALAKVLGITCSLRVLDLTPIRFQIQKSSSLLEKIAKHEQINYSRKGGTPVSLQSRIAPIFRGQRAR